MEGELPEEFVRGESLHISRKVDEIVTQFLN
jgi:hypothetical protein